MLAAVATLVAMVCLPAPAFALPPGTNITIVSAGPDSTGDPYDLTVVASDANGQQLASMTAHVYAGATDVADVPMSFQSGVTGNPYVQTWAATSPILQSALPPGTYTVTVDAADNIESDTGLQAPTPTFSFAYTTTVSVKASPPSVTVFPQNVLFTGTVMGQAPGGTVVPLPDVPVYLDGGSTSIGVTNSSGGFTDTVDAVAASADYNFSVNADPGGTYSAGHDDVTVNAVQAPTAMTVTPSQTSVTEGSQDVTFSGSVTVTPSGGSAEALANAPVYLDGNPTSITTDSNGNFTYQATGIAQTTTYTFSIAATPLYAAASTPVIIQANLAQTTIAVPTPNPVTYGSETVNFTGKVTALQPQPGGATVPVANAPVYLDGNPTSITTDSNGNFTYQATGVTQATTYTFSVNATYLHSAYSDPVTVTATPGTTNVTATANPPFVNLGSSTVTFTGDATVGSANLGVPSGTPVYLSVNNATPPTEITTTTDSAGDFSYTATGVTKNTTFNFIVNSGTLYTQGTYDVSVNLHQLTTNLTVTPNPANVTEGSQIVIFTGVVTGTSGSGSPQPIAGVPIDLNGLTTTQVATTDSQGQFTYKVSGLSDTALFKFSVAQTPDYTEATDNVQIGVVPATTRFTGAKVTPAHLKYGQKATLTGSVQYLSGKTWANLAGGAVHLFEGRIELGSVSTAKNGSFKATLPTTHGPPWRATLSAALLLQQASAIGNLSISVPMRVKTFTASLSVLGSIKAAGCLEVTVPVHYGPQSKIEIQYAAGSRGPWKELGKLQLRNVAGAPALCRDANESYFGGSIRAKLANAYYRADFPGNYSFQPTVSSVIHAWRYQTRITNYKVSPRAISTGGKVRISGRLWVRGKTWRPYAKRKVDIIYNEKGTSYWAHLGNPVKTSANGYFSQIGVGSSGKFVAIFYAFYPGSKTDLAAESNGVPVAINESSTTSPGPPAPTPTSGRLPVIDLPTYRGLGMLAQDAADIAANEIRALAFWPR